MRLLPIRSRFRARSFALGLSGCLLLSATGCKSLSLPNSWTWWKPSLVESKAEVPERIVVIWADDTLTMPGKPPVRGFGGRVYFYNAQDKTIPVEGQLIVYGYDDTKKSSGAQRVPDRKFAFTTDQFKAHYDESALGPSYSIWLPWDPMGGEQKEISFVPVFTSTSGKVVMGKPSVNVLPGKPTDPNQPAVNRIEWSQSTTADPPSVRPASHLDRPSAQAAPVAGDASATKTRSFTIPMNESMSRRMREAAASETSAPQADSSGELVPSSSLIGTPAAATPSSNVSAPPSGATLGTTPNPAAGATATSRSPSPPVLTNNAWPFAPGSAGTTARPSSRSAPRQSPAPTEPTAR